MLDKGLENNRSNLESYFSGEGVARHFEILLAHLHGTIVFEKWWWYSVQCKQCAKRAGPRVCRGPCYSHTSLPITNPLSYLYLQRLNIIAIRLVIYPT